MGNRYPEFWEQWYWLLRDLLEEEKERNERTGQEVRIHHGPRSLFLDLSSDILPTCGLRKTSPRVAAAETAWQVLGTQNMGWFRKHSKIWDQFAEHENCSYCKGDGKEVTQECRVCHGTGEYWFTDFAYGYRMRGKWRDQLHLAVAALRLNPSDRRVYVSLWDPQADGLGAKGQKNVPCPVGFSIWLQRGSLHMTLTIRSSDAFVGLPYDVMNFSMLQSILANTLSVKPGILGIMLSNVHLYESHNAFARECLEQQPRVPGIKLPPWTLNAVEKGPDLFVEWYATEEREHSGVFPTYNPRPSVHA